VCLYRDLAVKQFNDDDTSGVENKSLGVRREQQGKMKLHKYSLVVAAIDQLGSRTLVKAEISEEQLTDLEPRDTTRHFVKTGTRHWTSQVTMARPGDDLNRILKTSKATGDEE
jgi:hypothetical protein